MTVSKLLCCIILALTRLQKNVHLATVANHTSVLTTPAANDVANESNKSLFNNDPERI